MQSITKYPLLIIFVCTCCVFDVVGRWWLIWSVLLSSSFCESCFFFYALEITDKSFVTPVCLSHKKILFNISGTPLVLIIDKIPINRLRGTTCTLIQNIFEGNYVIPIKEDSLNQFLHVIQKVTLCKITDWMSLESEYLTWNFFIQLLGIYLENVYI